MHKEVIWYFVDLLGQRKGPITQQQLLDAIAEGRLRAASLVWREGLAQWQPLSSMEHELRPANEAIPPLPPSVPPALIETNPFATSPSGFVADWAYTTHSNEVVYGGFSRRFLALLLDALILWVVSIVLFAALAVVIGTSAPGRPQYFLWAYPAMFLISLLYWSVQESSSHQATFGKRALGIKVTDLDGQPIGWGRAVGRWFGRLLSGLLFCIGYLMTLFTSRKQALHDMLASTLVVDRWAYTQHPERQKNGGSGAIAAVCILLLVFFVIVPILAAIAIPQYQTYVMRSQIMNAYGSAVALRPNLVEAYQREQRCPVNGEAGLLEPEAYAAQYVTAITIGTAASDTDHCTLGVILRSTNLTIDGKHLWLSTAPASDSSNWTCRSDAPEKYLPLQCR
jgi:uncharacterized RDD family membrane protein YckC/Tfp pilus assembly major pilin PilA